MVRRYFFQDRVLVYPRRAKVRWLTKLFSQPSYIHNQLGSATFVRIVLLSSLPCCCCCCCWLLAGEEAGQLSWGGTCSAGLQQSPINLPSSSAAARACGSQAAPVFQ
jgi:hypothetical protein